MKLINALVIAALVLFAAGAAHADDTSTAGDSRLVTGGADPPAAPTCNGFQGSVTASGTLSADCTVAADTIATSITFAVPVADLLGTPPALSCSSQLTLIGWSESSSLIDGGTVAECTFTAPSDPNGELAYLETPQGLLALVAADILDGEPSLDYNDGDCDLDDFLVGIPGAYEGGNGAQGCDITFATPSGATIANTEAFSSDAPFAVSPDGVNGLAPFPEPSSLALLLLGLAPLAFLRRRAFGR